EGIRDLDQNARAVTGERIGADRAAMLEVHQDLQALADDVVRLDAFAVDNEAHPASVVLAGRIVETLSLRHRHYAVPNSASGSHSRCPSGDAPARLKIAACKPLSARWEPPQKAA